MKNETLQRVLAWMKGTDLIEVHRSTPEGALSLRLADSQAPVEVPSSPLAPVLAPAVGVFRFSAPGRPRSAEKGARVAAGQELGVIETGSKTTPVKAPAPGRIAQVMVEEGTGVEFGRPLFLVEGN